MSEEENIEEQSKDNSPQLTENNNNVYEPSTINEQPSAKTMEVHKHPHHVTHKKKWGEYLLEFFMLFFAVFLGFIAENIRESSVERHREKEYIKSLIEDFKGDSSFLAMSINQRIPYHIAWMDSAIHLLQLPNLKGKEREVYQAFFLATSWTYNYHPNERTISQLHSEGFHLIRNEIAVKAISLLEVQSKYTTTVSLFCYDMQNDLDAANYIFADRNVTDKIGQIAFKNYYLDYSAELKLSDIPEGSIINTSDQDGIQAYIKKLQKYANYVQTALKGQDISYLRSITNTISILENEYHIENE